MLIIGIICVCLALCAGVWASYRDVVSMTIPNRCSAIILVLWLIAGISGSALATPLLTHLIVGLVLLIVSLIFYSLKVWGGGDSKLMVAFGFWMVPHQAIAFVFWMTIIGGILAVISLILKKKVKGYNWIKRFNKNHWLQQMANGKAVIPYGVAISIAAMIVMIPKIIQ